MGDTTRRTGPRIQVESMASELRAEGLREALVLDVAENGLRLERALGGPRTRILQLEIEVPGVDEIVWARGVVCFDELRRAPGGGARGRVQRLSGVKLLAAATRHRRLLREFVNDTYLALRSEDPSACLPLASCYLRG